MMMQLHLHSSEERPSNDDVGKLFWVFKDEKSAKYWFNHTPVIYDGDWINVWNNERLKYNEYSLWTKIPSESLLFNPEATTFTVEEIKWYSPEHRLPVLINIDDDNKFFSNPVTAIVKFKTKKSGDMFYHYILEYCSDGCWYVINDDDIENRRRKLIVKNAELIIVCWTETTDIYRDVYRKVRRGEI